MAGVGKVFDTGAKVIAGFANQVVFNFIGHNSIQPKVQSFLPVNIFLPFLRGGGRAVTLEPLTQAERSLLYAVRAFAKFRQEFIVATLVGGTDSQLRLSRPDPRFTGGGNTDPIIGFINVLEDIQLLENYRRNIAAFEQLVKVYTRADQGRIVGPAAAPARPGRIRASRGPSRTSSPPARPIVATWTRFKMQMGLPPDTPLMSDRSLTQPFQEVFDAVDDWQRDPKREPGGSSQVRQTAFPNSKTSSSTAARYSECIVQYSGDGGQRCRGTDLEDLLLAAERTALEHRLDLMNTRAQLYDAWRQTQGHGQRPAGRSSTSP